MKLEKYQCLCRRVFWGQKYCNKCNHYATRRYFGPKAPEPEEESQIVIPQGMPPPESYSLLREEGDKVEKKLDNGENVEVYTPSLSDYTKSLQSDSLSLFNPGQSLPIRPQNPPLPPPPCNPNFFYQRHLPQNVQLSCLTIDSFQVAENNSHLVGFFCHFGCLKHPSGHKEKQERLTQIKTKLSTSPLLGYLPTPITAKMKRDKGGSKRIEECISRVHKPNYINAIKGRCQRLGNNTEMLTKDSGLGDDNTQIGKFSYEAALYAVDACITACDCIMAFSPITSAFCAIRPPGHHAYADRGNGFCIFNNAAIAAKYLQKEYNLKRIAIVDWDYHYGDGTQSIISGDSSILYFSTHNANDYPKDQGRRNTLKNLKKTFKPSQGLFNLDLGNEADDSKIVDRFLTFLVPWLEKFKPEFIIISAGFDAHIQDPVSSWEITDHGYQILTEIVQALACTTHCRNRILSILEGGYDVEKGGLASAVLAHISQLSRWPRRIDEIRQSLGVNFPRRSSRNK